MVCRNIYDVAEFVITSALADIVSSIKIVQTMRLIFVCIKESNIAFSWKLAAIMFLSYRGQILYYCCFTAW